MAKDVQVTTPVRPDYLVKRNTNGTPVATQISMRKLLTAIFDTGANDSSGVSNKTVATHGLGIYLPPKAIVTRTWWEVVTGFTSGSSLAQIALTAESAGDLKAATVISNAAYSTSGTFEDGVQSGAASAYVQTTVEREVKAAVSVEALTAGKLLLCIEFVQGL